MVIIAEVITEVITTVIAMEEITLWLLVFITDLNGLQYSEEFCK
jgi:hypothetical protein